MTRRNLPQIEAFIPEGLQLDPPASVHDHFTPVEAKTGDDPERTLAITGEIGSDYPGGVSPGYVRGALRRMGKGPVTIALNSKGGDYFTGVAIYNLLREHDGEVTTKVLSLAASAGSVIAMASDKIMIPKSGFMMVHNASGVVIGNRHDMRETADLLEKFDGAMAGIYADRTKLPRAEIDGMMDAETFLGGEDAIEAGFADELLPADQIKKSEESPAEAALNRLDTICAQHGLSRRERRALFSEVAAATPSASRTVTPSADFIPAVASIQRATKLFKER